MKFILNNNFFIKILYTFLLLTTFNSIILASNINDKFYEEMKLADSLITESKLNQALAVYDALLLKDPQYKPALLAIGSLYTRMQKYSQAEGLFLKVINTGKDLGDAYERLSNNYLSWSKSNKESSAFLLKKAKSSIDQALIYDMYNYKSYLTQSLIYIEMKEYDKGLQSIYKALNITPSNSDCYVNLGILYTSLEKYDLALQNFEKAIHLNSRNSRAYNHLGKMLAKASQPRQAIQNLNKSSFYDIFITAEDHFLLGQLYEQLGDFNNAIQEFYSAFQLKPMWTECLINIALIYEKMSEDQKSIEAYQKAIAIDYSIMDNMVNKARDYFITEDLFRARKSYIKILKIEPGNKYGFEGLISINYLSFLKQDFNLTNWFHDQSLLKINSDKYPRGKNLNNVNWFKFSVAKDGLNNLNNDLLSYIANSSPDTFDDYQAKSIALFIQGKYKSANESIDKTINKLNGLHSTNENKKEYYLELLNLADSLFSLHEFIKSREIYDKLNNIQPDNKAIEGLSAIANNVDNSKSKLVGLIKVISNKKPMLSQEEIIHNFKLIIGLYPQNSETHYYYSEFLAKIHNYEQALEELLRYDELKDLSKFSNMPSQKEVEKKFHLYRKLIDKNKQ